MSNNGEIPLYKQITDELRKKILNRELLPNQKLPTELELAEKFGVSRITSKRALEELRKEGLIYRKRGQGSFVSADVFKKNKKSTESKVISMILPFDDSTGRSIDYIRGASDLLNSKGYYLSIHCTNGYAERERDFLDSLPRNGSRGIIYYPVFNIENYEILYNLCLYSYPIVTIDKYFEGIPLSYVVSDNFHGGYEAVSYLAQLGHTRIAYVSSIPIWKATSIKNRYFGYCKALKEYGIEIDYDIIVQDYIHNAKEAELDINRSKIKSLLEKGVTAIFAEYDYVAIEIVKILRDIGVKVPDEISVIGFDNIEVLEHLDIPLTTINQDFYKIGWRAAELVVSYIEKREYTYQKITLPVELVIRSSVAQIRKECNIESC